MKLRKTKRIKANRMSKHQMKEFYENIDQKISNLSEEDQKKVEFARNFVNEIMFFEPEEGTQIQIGPLDLKSLQYFAFSILIEYDIRCGNRNV